MTKEEEKAKEILYGIGCLLILGVLVIAFVFYMIVLPVVGCIIIAIYVIIIIKKKFWKSKTKKILITGVLIQVSGLIFCFIWSYIVMSTEIIEIWKYNTGQTAVDFFFLGLYSINLCVGFINLVVIVILHGYLKPRKKGIKPKKGKWKTRMVEYDVMCKQIRSEKILSDKAEKEAKFIGSSVFLTEKPKRTPVKLIHMSPEETDYIWQYCKNCKSKMLPPYFKCDLCGWQLNSPKEETEKEKRSRTIPKHVQREVWRRDMGKCVECETKEKLEYDHIIPFSKGGSNTVRNIQLLCQDCNRKKYNKIGGG